MNNTGFPSLQFIKNQDGDREAKPANSEDIQDAKERGIQIIGVSGIGALGVNMAHFTQDIIDILSTYERFDNHMVILDGNQRKNIIESNELTENQLQSMREEKTQETIEHLIFALTPREDISDIITTLKKTEHKEQDLRNKYFHNWVPKIIKKSQIPSRFRK